ncbi:MAG TPA: bifunctional UDP-sugar hydrolase/5'-nucleotidase [Thermoanaerobaculia bacterium]|nr:bifunctional UDP-sugar hydrolase/5'-nucleotidase [Thermoanaerobaculia bacterium]
MRPARHPHDRHPHSGRRPIASPLAVLALAGGLLASCASPGRAASPPVAVAGERTVTLLTVNDVYRIEGVDDGAWGGMPRLRTLRLELEGSAPDLLVLHAGDFLFPSLLSHQYRGEQMVDLLNLLDGSTGAFDERLFVVFGNHEFDRDRLADAAMLDSRVEESEFRWLGTNVEFLAGDDGLPLVAAEQLVPAVLVESAGVTVGIFGLTTDAKHPAYVERFADPVEVAREAVADLRRQGAEVVVALTHLTIGQDAAMLRALGEEGPDLVVGGHEHNRQVEWVGRRPVIKADAEARTAAVVEIDLPPGGGPPQVRHRFAELGPDVEPDPQLAARVDEWLVRHDREYCTGRLAEPPGCLDVELARADADLVGEELEIRRFETNFGNWIADRALDAHRERGAQLAFLNAGSLRLNQDLPAGSWVSRRHVEEMFPYPGDLELLTIDGATLGEVLERAVSDWTGVGWWLQVSGLAFRHDPATATVRDLTLLTADGPRPIRPDERLRVVTGAYLVDPSGDQDGYTMLGPWQRVPDAPALDLKQLVVAALTEAGAQGIAPCVEGRICNTERPGPCLAVGDGP